LASSTAAAFPLRRAAQAAQPSISGKHTRSMMAWVRGETKSVARRAAGKEGEVLMEAKPGFTAQSYAGSCPGFAFCLNPQAPMG
jgi:hypothetical protein